MLLHLAYFALGLDVFVLALLVPYGVYVLFEKCGNGRVSDEPAPLKWFLGCLMSGVITGIAELAYLAGRALAGG